MESCRRGTRAHPGFGFLICRGGEREHAEHVLGSGEVHARSLGDRLLELARVLAVGRVRLVRDLHELSQKVGMIVGETLGRRDDVKDPDADGLLLGRRHQHRAELLHPLERPSEGAAGRHVPPSEGNRRIGPVHLDHLDLRGVDPEVVEHAEQLVVSHVADRRGDLLAFQIGSVGLCDAGVAVDGAVVRLGISASISARRRIQRVSGLLRQTHRGGLELPRRAHGHPPYPAECATNAWPADVVSPGSTPNRRGFSHRSSKVAGIGPTPAVYRALVTPRTGSAHGLRAPWYNFGPPLRCITPPPAVWRLVVNR